MSLARGLIHVLAVVVLTLLTQLGGIAYLLACVARRQAIGVFLLTYIALSLGAAYTAPAFGRVPLPCTGTPLRSQSLLYCALNRHYVSPDLKQYLQALATAMTGQFPGTVTLTLDGSFPFLDGFPLLPHLSHDDGDKVDLAFYYRDRAGAYQSGTTASLIGFWAFETPSANAPLPCEGVQVWPTLRWDMGWLTPLHRDLVLEPDRTGAALRWLTQNIPDGHSLKILLEPHLTERLGLTHPTIRFQGCRAARHDDHIHLQIATLP